MTPLVGLLPHPIETHKRLCSEAAPCECLFTHCNELVKRLSVDEHYLRILRGARLPENVLGAGRALAAGRQSHLVVGETGATLAGPD